MDPMTTAALIKTGGTIISGLLGGKKKRGPSPTDMIGYQSMADHQAFDDKMTLAAKYKIHPLTMLGVNTSGTFTAPVYEDRSDNMGQNIASAITKGASDYFTGKAAQEMEDLSLERARLENELLRTQITSVGRSPSTTVGATQAAIPQGDNSRVNVVPDEQIASDTKNPEVTAGKHPAYMTVQVAPDRYVRLPWSDEGWAEGLEGLPAPYAYGKMGEIFYKTHDSKTPGYWLAKKLKKIGKYPSKKWKGK